MTNYGMTSDMLEQAKYKVKKNKSFMQNNGIILDGNIVPFSAFVANAYTNAHRYVAELQHRAWSIFNYAKEHDLTNVFVTLTAEGEYHPTKTLKNGLRVNNSAYNGVEPKEISKYLSELLNKLYNERAYRNIPKDKRAFFRVTEPHKDGTPHVHISFFMPDEYVADFVKAVNRLFPAPQSKIETNVNSPVAYLMKYVLKTLDDLRGDNAKLTALTYWYVHHGISRFYTSRTLVSLQIYRKLNGKYDLNTLTHDYNEGKVAVYHDTWTGEIVKIENEFGPLYTRKHIMDRFQDGDTDKYIDLDQQTYNDYEYEPLSRDIKHKKPIDVIIDGEEFILIGDRLSQVKEQPYQMSDQRLYSYFKSLDNQVVDENHHHCVMRELLSRNIDNDLVEAEEVF